MYNTLKEIRTAILVISVLLKNPNTPAPLKVTLEESRKDLIRWFLYLQKKEQKLDSQKSK